MRKLSTVAKVLEVKPLENSDRLDVVKIRGWQVVTVRNKFKENDLCVYFEIDSLLPIKPEFEFLRKNCYVKQPEGFRIKTIKLRGQLSQGLALSFSDLNLDSSLYVEDSCLDKELGIQLYTPIIPASLSGKVLGNRPFFIPKTDQERVQNIWNDLQPLFEDLSFEETLKLDGASISVYFYNSRFGVCSRNMELLESENNAYWEVVRKYNLQEELTKLGKNICLQGELMGEGIQKNREQINKRELFIYDIWDIDKQTYLGNKNRYYLCDKLKLNHVPIISTETSLKNETLDSLLERAKGKSLNSKIREGIVFKEVSGGISFKVINNDFLIKFE